MVVYFLYSIAALNILYFIIHSYFYHSSILFNLSLILRQITIYLAILCL